MGYKMKGFFISIWKKLKLLVILAILAGLGYGAWIGWKTFIKNTQNKANRGGANRAAAIEAKTK